MRRSRFSEEQVIAILREQEAGGCDRRSVSAPRYLGRGLLQVESEIRRMEVSDAKRLRALEDENRRLKKLPAASPLDNAALKDLLAKTA